MHQRSIRADHLAFASFATRPPRPSLFPPPPSDPARHPWLLTFEQSPEAGFAALVAGQAPIAPYDRLDAPEAAQVLFGRLPADDPARLSLGWAILGWLDKRRRETLPDTFPQRQSWVREVREAFDIVALLGVKDAALQLRRAFPVWNAWTSDLVLAPSRDARAAYWRMLALTQPLLCDAASGIDPFSLAPYWLWICENAGGKLPDHYLAIGLIGLRRLPDIEPGAEMPWLIGLARWADVRRPTEAAFRTQWLALKSLYPRTQARWQKLVAEVLSEPRFQRQGIVAPGWWAADPAFQ
jgi:hypothetical protein